MALDTSQYYKDPATGISYTSFASFQQNTQGVALPATADPNTGQAITPESLKTTSVAGFGQPPPTLVPPVPEPTPVLTPTPEETQAQGISDRLTTLNDQLVGKSAAQTSANEQYGVNKAQTTINDLNARLIGLKNQEAAIPLLLDKSSAGITTAVYDAQKTAMLRDNAIEALTVSSLMAAASGQLSNAQSMADRAVAAKYDPIQEQITAVTNNLNVILNSPNYNLSEKNRVQKQLDIQNAKQDKIDQQKADAKIIQATALDAASKGADSQTLDAISKAKTPTEATQLATQFEDQQTNQKEALASKVTTPAVNKGGKFYDAKTGKVYAKPEDFFKAVGVKSFAEAYAKKLVTDINPTFAKTGIASYDEWQLYKSQGGSLGYNDYQTMDINRKRSVTNNITPETKIVDKFNEKASSWDLKGTREQLIRRLQGEFPSIDGGDIQRKVYEIYPNGYDS